MFSIALADSERHVGTYVYLLVRVFMFSIYIAYCAICLSSRSTIICLS